MLPELGLDDELLTRLLWWDAELARVVAASGCRRCQGPLHQANYARKPRGGRVIEALESLTLRRSLCCGHCRARSQPPSVLFLGRRVYLGAVVLIAGVTWSVAASVRELAESTGVPAQTLRRWTTWWRDTWPSSPVWTELRARFAPPPPDEATLPSSLVARVAAHVTGERAGAAVLLQTALLMAPITTRLPSVARFVRAVAQRLGPDRLAQKMMVGAEPIIS